MLFHMAVSDFGAPLGCYISCIVLQDSLRAIFIGTEMLIVVFLEVQVMDLLIHHSC